jgi:hypothetical protein
MKELKQQLVSALAVVLTVAAVVAAARNFQQQSRVHLTDDGVTWADHNSPDGETSQRKSRDPHRRHADFD